MFYSVKKRAEKIVHTQNCFHIRSADVDGLRSFDKLSTAYKCGYRFCKHCNTVKKQYQREKEQITDICRRQGLSVWETPEHLCIWTPYSEWRLFTDEHGGLDLYHRNMYNPAKETEDVVGYHWQGDFNASSLAEHLTYIVEHDAFRKAHPVPERPWEKAKKESPRKGTRRYRKAEKEAKRVAKKKAARKVMALIDSLHSDCG